MNRIQRQVVAMLVTGATLVAVSPARACTTFVIRDQGAIVVGKSFDFFLGDGRVMTNQRGVTKTALLMEPGNPARWVSRYGSLTFNQVSKEYPFGGMNEAGLVVETMSLADAAYPAADERAALSELQWVQYQLDTCASVPEVLASNAAIRITGTSQPLHFLVADRLGNVATIEFLAGRRVDHTGDSLLVPVLTNNTYDTSLAYLRGCKGFGGSSEPARSPASLDRFATAASLLQGPAALRDGKTDRRALQVLDAVNVPQGTVWQIVYDLERHRIHFRTTADRTLRHVDLGDFDFDCAHPARLLDLGAHYKGNVASHFVDYRTEMNRELVRATFARYRQENFVDLPAAAQEFLSRYPETLPCTAAAAAQP